MFKPDNSDCEGQFRSAFANAAIGFAITSPDGRYLHANPAYCALTGYSLDELRTLSVSNLIHPDDLAETVKSMDAMLAGEMGGFVIENRCVRKDGTAVWVRKSVSLVRGAKGAPSWIIVLVDDIAERKWTEEALRRRTAELDSIVMNAPFGFAFFDREHRYVRVNEELCRMNGIAEEAHLGRRVSELLPGAAATIDPLLDEVFATGNALESEVFVGTPKDPGVVRHWHVGFSPVFDDRQRVTAVGAFLIETTQRKQAEDELRRSRDLLGLAQTIARAGSFNLDLKTGEVWWSDELRQLYGLRPEDSNPSLETWTEWILAEDLERVSADTAAGMKSGEVLSQFRIRRVDTGEVRWLERRGRVWRDENGTPEKLIGLSIDITEQKNAEAELRNREARQAFLAGLADRLRSLADERGIIMAATEALARHLGLAEVGFAEMPAGRDRALVRGAYSDGRMPGTGVSYLHDDESIRTAMRSGQTFFREGTEERGPGRGGARPGTKSMKPRSAAAVPLIQGGGSTAFLYAFDPEPHRWPEEERHLFREVAEHAWAAVERAQAEARLRESEARFRSVVEANMIGVVFADPVSGEITDANDEYLRIIGRSREELEAGKLNWKEITSPETLQYEAKLAAFIPLDRRVPAFEKEYIRADGTRVPVILGGYFMDDTGRRVVAFVLDNSERKRNEERLRHTQKLESIGLLAGGIAHDFNNLLTVILGNSSLALNEIGPAPAERIREVVAAADRAAHLTRQLLAYAGKGQSAMQALDVSEAVHEIIDLVQVSIPRSIELAIHVQKRLPLVQMDPSQLQQVLMNLVINAGEAIGEGKTGRITIATFTMETCESFPDALGQDVAPGRYVCIEISDTGAGIDEAVKGKIFDPFFTTRFVGRGLGLAAVAGILRSHKGAAITLKSAPGAGSTFRVLLPVAIRGLEAAEEPAAEGRATVLVVDDEPAVRAFISAVLHRDGYRVLEASDGREALAVCEREAGVIDLAIVDVMTPVTGADELRSALRARRPDAKIILTSGLSEADARRLVAAFPESAFIQKPYTAQQIAKTVEELLGVVRK